MSTTPRLEPAIDGAKANSKTVLGHSPAVRKAFDQMYATLWSRGEAPVDVKELIRLRNARVTGCGL